MDGFRTHPQALQGRCETGKNTGLIERSSRALAYRRGCGDETVTGARLILVYESAHNVSITGKVTIIMPIYQKASERGCSPGDAYPRRGSKHK